MDDRTLASKRQTTEPPCNLSLSAKCPRVKSPEPRVTEFVFFGLQFYYLEVKDEMEMRRNVIKFSTFDAKGSEDMKRTIPEDMKNLNNGDVGTKTGYKANGYFLKVEGLKDRCAYVYTHTQHAQCSQTRLLQISYCLQAEQKKLYLPECKKMITSVCSLSFIRMMWCWTTTNMHSVKGVITSNRTLNNCKKLWPVKHPT